MGAVAQLALLRMLTGAEIDRAVGVCREGNRREGGTFMAAVAERLVFTVSTRAPVVGLAGFDENGNGRLLRDVGGGHGEKIQDG